MKNKKLVVLIIGIIVATIIGGVIIVGLNKKTSEPKEPDKKEEVIEEEEPVEELQDWQEDYARVLLELLYLPVANFSWSEGWEELEALGSNLDRLFARASEEVLRFALMDVNGDDIPELFVKAEGDESLYYYYMFTTGDNISDCFLGRINYVDTDTKEIIRRCGRGLQGSYHVVYRYNGTELVEQMVYGSEYREMETPAYIYDWYPEGTGNPAKSLTKEEYDQLQAKYDRADEFQMDLKELTWENISEELNVSIAEQDRKLLECLREVCISLGRTDHSSWEDGYLKSSIQIRKIDFNGDDIPDYEYTPFSFDYYYGIIVSSEDAYYRYESPQGLHSSYHSYVEGEGKLIYEGVDSGNFDDPPKEFIEVYEMNEKHEFVHTYSVVEVYKLDEKGNVILNSEGYGESHVELHQNNETVILSSEQSSKMLAELHKEETSADEEYVMVSDLLYKIEISLAK